VSQENVEIVRDAIEAFMQRDLDAVVKASDPEIVVDWSRSSGLEAGIYRGYEATRAFWGTFLDTFDPMVLLPDEFIDCGDHVVVPNTTRAWGRDGIMVEAKYVAVVTLRNGRIVEWRLYQNKAEALKAVGLEE
jgi:ketosteroid isomerase-like protein